MLKGILSTVLLILIAISLSMYLTLIMPIGVEAKRLGKELFDKHLAEEKECIQMKESMKTEPRFKLECIEIGEF